MISNDLKEILELAGGRYIIVENGKPKYIVMNFDEYKEALIGSQKNLKKLTEEELIKKINEDIALWKESQPEADESLVGEIEKLEEIKYI